VKRGVWVYDVSSLSEDFPSQDGLYSPYSIRVTKQNNIPSMAPNLAASQHLLIGDMVRNAAAGCSESSIRTIATNL